MSADTGNSTLRYRRLVLTLNLNRDDNQVQAVERTVYFAGEFNSDVACLCVRDSDLLDYAALPFAREFSLHGAQARALNADEVRSDMDRRASSIRSALEKSAPGRGQRNSFLIVDGRLDEKVVETAEEGDLLVMTVTPAAQRNLGATYDRLCKIVERRHCDLLLLPESRHSRTGDIVLIAHDAIPCDRALRLVFHSAQQRHLYVKIIIADNALLTKAVERRCHEVLATTGDGKCGMSFHSLSRSLRHPWRHDPCSLVVTDFADALPSLGNLSQSLSAFLAPLLLLRRPLV